MAKAKSEDLIPVERIAAQIYVIRGQSVMLDSDLAEVIRREHQPTERAGETQRAAVP